VSEDDKKKLDKQIRTMTPKQQIYVKERVHNPNSTDAEKVVAAGFHPKDQKSAASMATALNKQPKVQESIRREIEKMYPDRLGKNVEALARIADSLEARPSDVISAVKELNAMAGYKAATQHQRLTANITVPKLPKE